MVLGWSGFAFFFLGAPITPKFGEVQKIESKFTVNFGLRPSPRQLNSSNPMSEYRLSDRLPTLSFMTVADHLQSMRLAAWYTASRPHFIVVLGMHRSGTSCATRILNLMGASFGRTLVDQPAQDNGEIHWESANAVWINDEILRRTGGSWDRPPQTLRYTNRDRWRCRRFLWEYAGESLGLFKDPRLVLTYPLWNEVLPPHSIVVCARHPRNVARSLEKRDGIAMEHGLDLWRRYNHALLGTVRGKPGIIGFDFDQGGASAARLVRTAAKRFGLQATDDALNHYTADAHHHSESDDLPDGIARAYSELRELVDRAHD